MKIKIIIFLKKEIKIPLHGRRKKYILHKENWFLNDNYTKHVALYKSLDRIKNTKTWPERFSLGIIMCKSPFFIKKLP